MSVYKAELEAAQGPPEDEREGLLVHPLTGEAIDLCGASTDRLAAFLIDLREHESLLREVKRIITDEALRRMDFEGEWTLRAGAYTLTGKSSAPSEEFNELELREELLQFVDEGILSAEAVDRAIEPIITYKARKRGLTALRKLGGRVRETIDKHAREVQKPRYVQVERKT